MKKILSVVLCLAMLMSCFALLASANTEDVTRAVDGVISEGEYTASKVYAADASLQWQWTGSKGVTLTEYGAQDEDYVYFALVFDAEISDTEVYYNASAGVRYDWDNMVDYDWFTFSDIDADGVAGTYGVWAGGEIDQTSIAKIVDGNTVVEIKMSKESVMAAFGLDSLDAFAYYVDTAVLADGSGTIGNKTWLDNAEMDEHFSGREWGIWYAYYGVDGENEWYPNNTVLSNIVVLTGEELAETPAFYCTDGDDCTVEGHADRAEVLDLADLRDFGLLEGLYVPAAEVEETEPVETEPVETEPVETEPVETEPVETEPVESEPVETEPVETEPVESEPAESEPADPALPDPESAEVKANSVTVGETPDTYAVDISFGSMEFTYEINLNGWNPDTHAFEGGAQWVCTTDANKISVVNHSNVAINAEFTYTQGAGYTAINGAFDNAEFELASAVDTAVDAAPANAAYLTLSGDYEGNDDFVTVGTVTVVITKA